MSPYQYFGNGTVEIAGIPTLKKFGQRIMLSDATARDILSAGGGIISPEDFEACGFSPVEMKDKRERHGAAYMDKHQLALKFMRELKERLVHVEELQSEPV